MVIQRVWFKVYVILPFQQGEESCLNCLRIRFSIFRHKWKNHLQLFVRKLKWTKLAQVFNWYQCPYFNNKSFSCFIIIEITVCNLLSVVVKHWTTKRKVPGSNLTVSYLKLFYDLIKSCCKDTVELNPQVTMSSLWNLNEGFL